MRQRTRTIPKRVDCLGFFFVATMPQFSMQSKLLQVAASRPQSGWRGRMAANLAKLPELLRRQRMALPRAILIAPTGS